MKNPSSHLVDDRAGRDIDVGRGDGASLVRGHERRDGSNVIQGCGPRKQGSLLKTGDDLVAARDSLGKGLGDPASFDGDHANAVRTKLGGPLPAQPLERIESDLEAAQPWKGLRSAAAEGEDHARPFLIEQHVTESPIATLELFAGI